MAVCHAYDFSLCEGVPPFMYSSKLLISNVVSTLQIYKKLPWFSKWVTAENQVYSFRPVIEESHLVTALECTCSDFSHLIAIGHIRCIEHRTIIEAVIPNCSKSSVFAEFDSLQTRCSLWGLRPVCGNFASAEIGSFSFGRNRQNWFSSFRQSLFADGSATWVPQERLDINK